MSGILEARVKALQRQLAVLERFATTPTGLFETLDMMVRNFRMANRETLRRLGLGQGGAPPAPAKARGQLLRELVQRRPRLLRR